jgi:hypothetical protein
MPGEAQGTHEKARHQPTSDQHRASTATTGRSRPRAASRRGQHRRDGTQVRPASTGEVAQSPSPARATPAPGPTPPTASTPDPYIQGAPPPEPPGDPGCRAAAVSPSRTEDRQTPPARSRSFVRRALHLDRAGGPRQGQACVTGSPRAQGQAGAGWPLAIQVRGHADVLVAEGPAHPATNRGSSASKEQ